MQKSALIRQTKWKHGRNYKRRNRLDNGKIVHGSPILALAQPRSFDYYFFADLDSSNTTALGKRCHAFGADMSKIQIFAGDANQVVDEVCDYIHQVDKKFICNVGQSLNLAFLDPEGLELHRETVVRLASYRTDMIIYYPQMGITRDAEISPEAIDRFFGDKQSSQIYLQYKQGEERFLHRALLELNPFLEWPENVWMGVSVENSDYIYRIDLLRQTGAVIKFISAEPLLGPLPNLNLEGIHWVIVGGESGPHARPIWAEWVREIRDQCVHAAVPFFFKQWGGTRKKQTGRLLDNLLWDELPRKVAAA